MPVPQRVNFLVGWAGEPAHKRLIENGAISQFKPSILVEKPISAPDLGPAVCLQVTNLKVFC
jgi:hypothetical protein